MGRRALKRCIVLAVFCLGVSGLVWGSYVLFFKPEPTCFDGRQNGTEEGVDCGGGCGAECRPDLVVVPLVERELAFLPAGAGRYDALVRLYNPNDTAGFPQLSYTIRLHGADGAVLAERSGTEFILPQETKYIFAFDLSARTQPERITVDIEPGFPELFEGYVEKPKLLIINRRHGRVIGGAGYYEAYGLLRNDSPFDFNTIVVRVIARDRSGKALAINATDKRDVLSQDEWDFRLFWPSQFAGTVEDVEMEADTDVYHTENFMRQYQRR